MYEVFVKLHSRGSIPCFKAEKYWFPTMQARRNSPPCEEGGGGGRGMGVRKEEEKMRRSVPVRGGVVGGCVWGKL